jgi:hypothetical protein
VADKDKVSKKNKWYELAGRGSRCVSNEIFVVVGWFPVYCLLGKGRQRCMYGCRAPGFAHANKSIVKRDAAVFGPGAGQYVDSLT